MKTINDVFKHIKFKKLFNLMYNGNGNLNPKHLHEAHLIISEMEDFGFDIYLIEEACDKYEKSLLSYSG